MTKIFGDAKLEDYRVKLIFTMFVIMGRNT